ncbi:MAG: hypothetical protein ABIL09_12435, partial [Gemmatimonadota bacterium]
MSSSSGAAGRRWARKVAPPGAAWNAAALVLLLAAGPGGATAAHEAVGWRPTAIPIVNFSSDDGTGYGLRCSLYEYDGHSIP